MSLFHPTLRLRHYAQVTPELLRSMKIDVVLTDLDDTLAPRNVFFPDDAVRRWVGELNDAGIRVAIVSNNHKKRAADFADALRVPWIAEALKPSRKAIRTMMQRLNAEPRNTILLGDQLFTDVAAASRCGLPVILVDPVGTYGGWFVQFKRKCEIPFRRRIPYSDPG